MATRNRGYAPNMISVGVGYKNCRNRFDRNIERPKALL
jgi:hypothetical protein